MLLVGWLVGCRGKSSQGLTLLFPVRSLHQYYSGYTISLLIPHVLQPLIYFAQPCNGIQANNRAGRHILVTSRSGTAVRGLTCALLLYALTLPIFTVKSTATEPTLRMIPTKRQVSLGEDALAWAVVPGSLSTIMGDHLSSLNHFALPWIYQSICDKHLRMRHGRRGGGCTPCTPRSGLKTT